MMAQGSAFIDPRRTAPRSHAMYAYVYSIAFEVS
jgi:hypothetical protein